MSRLAIVQYKGYTRPCLVKVYTDYQYGQRAVVRFMCTERCTCNEGPIVATVCPANESARGRRLCCVAAYLVEDPRIKCEIEITPGTITWL